MSASAAPRKSARSRLIVRYLDVHVERRRACGAQLGELGRCEVRRDVDRRRAELLESAGRRPVRAGKQHRGLEDERLGKIALPLQPPELSEKSDVGDEKGADAERDATSRLSHAPFDPRISSRDARNSARRKGLSAEIPRSSGTKEERDLDPALRSELGHLRDLAVREHHHTRSLGHASHGHGSGIGLLEHSSEHRRTLHRRNLDPVAEAVGEARVGHPASFF